MNVRQLWQARPFSYYWQNGVMKKYYGFMLLLLTMFYAGCAAIETIFKAGMWVGILIVVVIIGLIFFVISKLFGRR